MELKKRKNKISTALFVAILISLNKLPIRADVLGDRLNTLSTASDEKSFVNGLLGLALPLGVLALIGLSGYSVFLMITSQGDPEKLKEAKDIITNAVLGFGLIGLSVAVLLLIQNVLNLPLT